MKTRWQFIVGLFAAVAAAAQGVIITAGESIFGPPLPSTLPTTLQNGQCPRCGHRMPRVTASMMDVIADHLCAWKQDGHRLAGKLLRDCEKCHAAFWQRMEDE